MFSRRTFIAGLLASAAARPLLAATTFPVGRGEDFKQALLKLRPEKASAADTLGSYGVLSIRSKDRLDRLLNTWAKLGWQKADLPFADVDWSKQSLVGVLDCGDVGNEIALGVWNGGAGFMNLDFFFSHTINKQRGKVENNPKLLLVAIPSPAAKVAVKSYTPHNGPRDSREKALTEWVATVGPDTGDSVGGLQGHITPAATKVKAGEDILLEFRLQLSDGDQKAGAFSRRPDSIYVWDGKYSNGYRNHAFHVVRPDGTVELLRPQEKPGWDKNTPHEEEISAGKPYVLPNWREGDNRKSLKELGLKIERGTYAITGIYSEIADEPKPDRLRRLPLSTWGGEIWTNTVTVEVV